MQIVIDIPEEIYNHTQRYEVGGFNQENDTKLFMAIKNGTPLQNGHGRLGDLDELEQRISSFVEHDAKITDEYTVTRQRFIVNGIHETTTIIDADNESKE